MRKLLVTAALLLCPLLSHAQEPGYTGATAHTVLVKPGSINWQPAPPSLPPGAQVAVLEGDPAKPGPFTIRLRLPDGYRIPPHLHPAEERVTVLSGTFLLGMGETFDASKLTALEAGGYTAMPAKMAHFVETRGETVVQLNNVGPWGLTYVNPADDPRKR